jgi:Predicted pyridoxal phosphate-dependent enzyme apparently involved in regulation of cell wall biogenesis
MEKIQMVDLSNQYLRLQESIDTAISKVLISGQYIQGQQVKEFAEELAAYTGSRFVIPCGNGTDALQIALMSLGLNQDSEILVPAFTYAATVETIALLNLTPVLVDVDPVTFNIDVSKLESYVSEKTRAIVPVHLFGQSADMEPILKLAKKYNLVVIEDNAQSIGAVYTFEDGTKAQTGTMGTIGTLSFFPTKNLGCYGDGGAILTQDEDLAEKLRMITSHGQIQKYKHQIIGVNSRLDTIQAAILSVKLKQLDHFIEARRKVAEKYYQGLKELDHLLTLPSVAEYSTHVYHQFTIVVKDGHRDNLKEYLQKKGIPSMIYYPIPMHQQPAFKYVARKIDSLEVSGQLCQSVLSLPMHTEMTDEQIETIIETIREYGRN